MEKPLQDADYKYSLERHRQEQVEGELVKNVRAKRRQGWAAIAGGSGVSLVGLLDAAFNVLPYAEAVPVAALGIIAIAAGAGRAMKWLERFSGN